jgi:glycine/D-amino acid oxidase-like deaminating enzyme
MYTMTPSGNVIVDMHPHLPCVSLAAGLSGHGFKFAPVLGEALADLAIDGKTSLPIEFLGLARHREASGH